MPGRPLSPHECTGHGERTALRLRKRGSKHSPCNVRRAPDIFFRDGRGSCTGFLTGNGGQGRIVRRPRNGTHFVRKHRHDIFTEKPNKTRRYGRKRTRTGKTDKGNALRQHSLHRSAAGHHPALAERLMPRSLSEGERTRPAPFSPRRRSPRHPAFRRSVVSHRNGGLFFACGCPHLVPDSGARTAAAPPKTRPRRRSAQKRI